eukprot:s366_g46.t1
MASHGRVPLADDEMADGKSIYDKLAKAKLVHLLKERAEQPELFVDEDSGLRSPCEEVRAFVISSGRIPRRQKLTGKAGSEEEKREDGLARRWATVVKEELPQELQEEYAELFEDEASQLRGLCEEEELPQELQEEYAELFEDGASQLRSLCEEVRAFVASRGRIPRRQRCYGNASSEDKKREDRLARRWWRLVSNRDSIPEELRDEFAILFDDASATEWSSRLEEVLEHFCARSVRCVVERTGCLPVRGPKSEADALAQRVRRVRVKTLESGAKKMRPAEQAYWESHFPGIWQRRRERDVYMCLEMR